MDSLHFHCDFSNVRLPTRFRLLPALAPGTVTRFESIGSSSARELNETNKAIHLKKKKKRWGGPSQLVTTFTGSVKGQRICDVSSWV